MEANIPAPQQSPVSTYGDVSSIPNPRTTVYGMMDERDTPGFALARALGVSAEFGQKGKQEAEKPPSQMQQEQEAALAAMGAERDRVKLAGGTSFFGLMKDPDASMDTYQLNRGRREADIYSGKLRDAYAASGLADNDDPKAFAAFVQQQQQQIFGEMLKDADPSYYHGFVTQVSKSFEDMATAHAGNLDTFVTSRTRLAAEERITQKAALDMTMLKESTAFGTMMNTLMGAESGGNYNAYFGNGGNQSVRFTDMTLSQVLEWQSSQIAAGAQSVAVGKYQFINKTLKEVIRQAGLDPETTKFSPAVQDKLVLTRLLTTRKFQDFLDGKITAEDYLDNHLAPEFAGLKKTSGVGEYDGDGLNKATLSSRKSIAALLQFRENYVRDPTSLKEATKNEDGLYVVGGDEPSGVGSMVENAETEFGITGVEARGIAANAYIKMLEADPSMADRDDLEDIMARSRLSREERDKVLGVRDRLRAENDANAAIQERERNEFLVTQTDNFLRTGDKAALAEIKQQNPEVHAKLLALEANPPIIENPKEAEQNFRETVPTTDPEFKIKALRAYADGQIDRAAYKKAVAQYDMEQNAKEVLELPGVEAYVSTMASSLPPGDRKMFESTLAAAVADLREANGGNRPAVSAVLAEVQNTYTQIAAVSQQRAAQIDASYTQGTQ